jgi:hypothetical protein
LFTAVVAKERPSRKSAAPTLPTSILTEAMSILMSTSCFAASVARSAVLLLAVVATESTLITRSMEDQSVVM